MHVYSSVYFNKTFSYSTQTGPSVISSEPTDVCFCDDNNTFNCSQKELTMITYPGEKINISFVTVGQNNGVAPGIVEIKALKVAGTLINMHNIHNLWSPQKCASVNAGLCVELRH